MRGWTRIVVLAALWAGLGILAGCGRAPTAGDQPLTFEQEREKAIRAAMEIYKKEKEKGTDLSRGPCIAQEAVPNWAVDVAHDPRQPVDDLPENQCASFREGRVGHFVELNPDGKLIRAE